MSTHIEKLSEQLAGLKIRAEGIVKSHLNRGGDRFSAEDAEDIVIEAYERAYAALHRFRGDATLSTWFSRIVKNCCVDAKRKACRHPVYSLEVLTHSVDDNEDVVWEFPDPGYEPHHERVENEEEKQLWRQLIGELSLEHRVIATLWFYKELHYDEMAEYLGVSIETVRGRLFKAKKALRKLALKEKYSDFNLERTAQPNPLQADSTAGPG